MLSLKQMSSEITLFKITSCFSRLPLETCSQSWLRKYNGFLFFPFLQGHKILEVPPLSFSRSWGLQTGMAVLGLVKRCHAHARLLGFHSAFILVALTPHEWSWAACTFASERDRQRTRQLPLPLNIALWGLAPVALPWLWSYCKA